MNSSLSKALLVGSAIGLFLAAPALAQTGTPESQTSPATQADTAAQQPSTEQAQPGQPAADQNIIVSTRRRDEVLKDVPVAVSAYTSARLDRLGVRDITDLQKTTPSLTLQTARGSNSTLIAFIRGVGQQDPLWGFDPGVGLYVDDVYIARPQAAVLDIFDVQRVEILRGPQGTLYGRNTIGGAIKYVTAKISGDPQISVRGQFGSYNEHDEIVSFKAPAGQFGFSASVAKYDHDGYGHNLTTGADQYNRDALAFRASMEWSPTSDLFFRLSADRTDDESNARHGHREAAFTTGGVTYLPPGNVYDTRAGAGDPNHVYAEGVSLLGQYNLSEALTFKSITAYRDGQTRGNIDFDEEAAPFLDIPAHYRDHQFSQEFQLVFNQGRVHGIAGLYYLNATAAGEFDTVLGAAGLSIFTGGFVDTRSYAGFADASFDVTSQLQVSVGGRYTKDEKTGHVSRVTYAGLRTPFFGNARAVPILVNTNYTNSKDFEKFTPRVSATYKFTPDLTGYASYSQGFKSGGFDMRGDAAAYPATVNGYRPETVDTYEVGLKGAALERRLNFATAVFTSKYKDQQITTQYPNSTGGIASVVDNVGSSRIDGVEAEGSVRVFDGLTLNAELSYLHTKFEKYLAFIPGTGLVDVSNQRKLQNTPKWTGAVSATYIHDLGGNGSISLTPLASYRSFTQQFETPAPLLDQPEYWLYDVDLVWTSPNGRYQVGLHGKNLSDERYKVGGYTFPGALFANSIDAFYGAPRTYTVSLSARW